MESKTVNQDLIMIIEVFILYLKVDKIHPSESVEMDTVFDYTNKEIIMNVIL